MRFHLPRNTPCLGVGAMLLAAISLPSLETRAHAQSGPPTVPAHAPARYAVLEIGAAWDWLVAINSFGDVALNHFDGQRVIASVWRQGGLELLGPGEAKALNDAGTVVGFLFDGSYSFYPLSPVRWPGGTLRPPPEIADPVFLPGEALCISNDGKIGGDLMDLSWQEYYPATWTADGVAQWEVSHGTNSTVYACSRPGNHRLVNAWWDDGVRIHDFCLLDGQVIGERNNPDLPWTEGAGVNAAGMVVGARDNAAFLYDTDGTFKSLPGAAWASAINDAKRPVINPQGEVTLQSCPQIVGGIALWEKDAADAPYHFLNLNQLIPPNVGWEQVSAVDINDGGAIAANARKLADDSDHPVLLVPAELLVDADRDGRMAFRPTDEMPDGDAVHAADQAANDEAHPYRFWINDDEEVQTPDLTGAEVVHDPASPARGYLENVLSNYRSLEDFSRLWVRLGGMNAAIRAGQVKVGLQWKPGTVTGDPRLKLFRSPRAFSRGEYLTSLDAANAQITYKWPNPNASFPACYAVSSAADTTVVKDGPAFVFPASFWDQLDEAHPETYLLFEGVGDGGEDRGGKGALMLVFFDAQGTKLGESAPVWLEIKNIRAMYRRAQSTPNDTDVGNGKPQYFLPYENYVSEPAVPPVSVVSDDNCYPFQAPADENKSQVIAFVHGWNVSYLSGQNSAQTVFKRLWWRGYKGRLAFYRWPSLLKLNSEAAYDGNYNASEYRAWKFGPALKLFLTGLRAEIQAEAPAGTAVSVHLMAHSQGNIVAASALQAGAQVDNYAMLNAAISASCYDSRAGFEQEEFLTAEGAKRSPQTLADGAYAEGLSIWEPAVPRRGRLEGISGSFANFYNPEDSALRLSDVNNRDLKPVYKGFVPNVSYKFYPDLPQGNRCYLQGPPPPDDPGPMPMRVSGPEDSPSRPGAWQTQVGTAPHDPPPGPPEDETSSRPVTDVHERMAFIARSLTYAAGREGNLGFKDEAGHRVGPVDAAKSYNENFDKEHSGQFERPIQKTKDFYDTLLDRFGIKARP